MVQLGGVGGEGSKVSNADMSNKVRTEKCSFDYFYINNCIVCLTVASLVTFEANM